MTFTVKEEDTELNKQQVKFQKFRSLVIDGEEPKGVDKNTPVTPFVKELTKVR